MIKEQTLVIVKPDGVQRSLIGEVIKRFESVGLKLVGMKMMQPSADLIEGHYTLDGEWLSNVGHKFIKGYTDAGAPSPTDVPEEAGKIVLKTLVNYMSSSPVVAMVWQGAHAVEVVRKLTGSTEPKTSDVGTIRGDYVHDSYILANGSGRAVRNLVHASGSSAEADAEIAHWFGREELFDYKNTQEEIMYDIDFDGQKE